MRNYLAEKFDAFLPKDPAGRTETLNWLFWQMGSAPYLGGGFGHFLMPTRRRKWNTRSTASPWKPSVSWMYSTAVWRKALIWPATATPSPTSPSGRGTGNWPYLELCSWLDPFLVVAIRDSF